MAEPTLSELSNIPSDAALGTAGMTDYVPTMHNVNQQVFEFAKFKAQMDWTKYTTFLNNFKEISKDVNEIAKMDIAPNDREELKTEMGNIFTEIEKNPKQALGGNGMFDIQKKLQGLSSKATLSKQDNLFDKYHRMFMDRVPDMKTDENKGKVDNYLSKQKLGERQPYILDAPAPEFDGAKLFSGILKNSTKPFSASYLNPADEAGKPMEGYIKNESGDEVNPNSVQGLWGLALTEQPEVAKAINKRYNDLPADVKADYDKNGGVGKFFSDLGQSYLGANFPDGSYEKTKEGNYRFNKKSDLKTDPNYLAAQKLAQTIKDDKEKNGIAWYNAKTSRINATKPDKTDEKKTDNGNIIYGLNGNLPGTGMQIKDGAVIDTKSGEVLPVNGDFPIPASFFDNSIFTEYNKYAGSQKMTKDGDGNSVVNEAINPSRLADEGGSRVVKFEDGVIVGIKTDKGDYATVDQFGYITNQANIKGVKKYQKQVDISGGKGTADTPKPNGKKAKFPLPKGQARTVNQGGYTYVWDESIGDYK